MATEDILISDGDSFVSLSALAAEQVDVKLPVESDDGSVTLESTGDKEFQITIGSSPRIRSEEWLPLSVNSGPTTTGSTLQKWLYTSVPANQEKFNMDLQQAVGSGTVSYAFVITDNAVTAEAVRFGKDEVVIGGQLNTDKITSKSGASNDASIDLGANLTVSTGGEERVFVRKDGMIGVGYSGQVNIGMCLYQDFETNDTNNNQEWGFVSAPKFDGQPSSHCVSIESQPQFTGVVANEVIHFKANDYRLGNQRFDGTQYGVSVSPLEYSNTSNIGFRSEVNVVSGRDNYAFVAGGSAPSVFNGDVQANKIVGATAPANDASIELGAEVEVRTDGRFIVAPQTRGPTLTDAVITAGSWNNNLGARFEFGWPNADASDYFARAAIRKDGNTSDLVYAHYSLTDSESNQCGHKFYSSVNGQSGIGNLLLELRETGTTISTGGQERVAVDENGLKVTSQNQQNETILVSGNSVSVIDCDPENKVANTAFGVKADGSYKLYMTQNGNFGIGDDNVTPLQKLTVDGDVSGASFVQHKSSTCGIFFPTSTSIEIHSSSNQTCFYADNVKTEVSGPMAGDASIELGAELLTTNHTPTQPNSIAIKQTVDDKIWVGTTAEYLSIDIRDINPTTLYCLTD